MRITKATRPTKSFLFSSKKFHELVWVYTNMWYEVDKNGTDTIDHITVSW